MKPNDRFQFSTLRTLLLISTAAVFAVGGAACGDDDVADPVDAAAADAAEPDASTLADLAVPCDDSEADVYTLPALGVDGYARGELARCARGTTATAAEINARLTSHGWNGPAIATDVEFVKIAFGTERSAPDSTATKKSLTSALVLIPKTLHATGPLPVIVAAHGVVGIGDHCTPSSNDLISPLTTFEDASAMYLGLAGQGYIVIAPDYAGYNYGDGPTGFFTTGDEVRSVLDSPKALRNLLPAGSFTTDAVIVGHSQGGNVALAAQSFAESYGIDGDLVGVLTYAPMWIAMRGWGAVLSAALGITGTNSPEIYLYATSYFYANGLAADGTDGRLTPFDAAKQAAVESFLLDNCRVEASAKVVADLGNASKDFFDDAFVDAVSGCALNPSACTDPLAARWAARWATGRPALSPTGAPVVIWGGGMDAFITPQRVACAVDKISADLGGETANKLTVCADTGAVHANIIVRNSEWATAWIENLTAGGPAPDACPGLDALGGGTAPVCDAFPPNVD